MKQKIELGTASAEPGKKAYGRLEVVKGVIDPLYIPILIVNGVEEGPTLVADCGIHGPEVTGGEAIMELGQELDPTKVKGTFIGVPYVNSRGYEIGSRGIPLEGNSADLNRIYPGKPYGPLSHIWVHTYFTNVILNADYVLSFHMGGVLGAPLQHVCCPTEKSGLSAETAKECKELSMVFGMKLVNLWPPSSTDPLHEFFKGTVIEEAGKKGIVAIMPEVGSGTDYYENYNYWVNVAKTGIYNVMKHLDMIDGEPKLPEKITILRGKFALNKHGGLWRLKAKQFDTLKKGDIIGIIVDPLTGEERERVISPLNGMLFQVQVWPIRQPGRWIAQIGEVIEEIEVKYPFEKY
jgi:predicted deacylase